MWLIVKTVKEKGGGVYNPDQTQAMKDIHNHPAVEEKPKSLGMSYYCDLWEIQKSHEKSSDIKTYLLHSNLFLLFLNSQENTNTKRETCQINLILI